VRRRCFIPRHPQYGEPVVFKKISSCGSTVQCGPNPCNRTPLFPLNEDFMTISLLPTNKNTIIFIEDAGNRFKVVHMTFESPLTHSNGNDLAGLNWYFLAVKPLLKRP